MNEQWSEMNKLMQKQISSQKTFTQGIDTLLKLREDVFQQISQIVFSYPLQAFSQMPYPNVKGYHSKTLAYSIWHIFRIEDIVIHDLILKDEQVLFQNGYLDKIGSTIITTGNELAKEQIVQFSSKINVSQLYQYAKAVKETTDDWLKELQYKQLSKCFNEEDRKKLIDSGCIADDESSLWLIDYWCSKNIKGLIQMPLSRHWIMHVEAMQRIKKRLCQIASKGIDPVAYCGFSCNHCFLSQWCGGCRSEYNTCSFALCSADKECPNETCCKQKGLDGCYQCEEIITCHKGFYVEGNDDGNAAKAQALFVGEYGKKAFLKVHDRLHQNYCFAKTQEVLGQDIDAGLQILKETYSQIKEK